MHSSRHLLLASLVLLVLVSCQQEVIDDLGNNSGNNNNPTLPSQSFEVKLNGTLTSFKVIQATLLRSIADNAKRLDIAGVSSDSSKRLVLTIGSTPATGNGVLIKDYLIRLFNEDDPNTPEDEGEDTEEGFLTYSTRLGTNSWVTDVYAENGIIKITANDASARTITGTFNIKDSSLTDGTVINFTEGKFNNIKYLVVN